MSYQTKNQSIGYILKGAIGTEIPANQLVDIASLANKIVPERNDIYNSDTLDYAEKIAGKIGLDEEATKTWKSEIYWTFDMKTVEQAEEFYDSFAVLFPLLNR